MTSEELKMRIDAVIPDFRSSDIIVLTGAGFTKNFGGFLAGEMHSVLFNNPVIQKSPSLRRLLLEDYDFESVYTEAIGHPDRYEKGDVAAMRTAIEDAYKSLDAAIKDWAFRLGGPNAVNPYRLSELFTRALVQSGRKGLFFTLNQDLFMERRWGYRWPGIPSFRQDFYTIDGGQPIPGFITVPNDEEVMKKAKADFENTNGIVYLKLHGSYGWRSPDGSNTMIVGKNKMEGISGSLILFWYFEILGKALLEGNKKLLILGYGFGDQHINHLLAEAVQSYGLRIFIISTKPMGELVEGIKKNDPEALPLIDGISGYFQQRLIEIFPTDQSETEYLRSINSALFS